MAEHLSQHGELEVKPDVLEKLGQMSVSTLWRLLPRAKRSRLAYRKSRPGASTSLRRAVPVRRIRWDEPQPGHFEVDLVHHCGVSSDGPYIHTLQMVDVASGWSECAATLGRSYLVMEEGFKHILKRLPFPVVELHPDNGVEFFNAFMLKFWKATFKGVQLSRSRPFQKNDNRFVEENNFSLVRAYLGYQRLDTAQQTKVLNQLYDQLWLYHNFFQPVMRLKEKVATDDPLRPKRIYDRAQTPFERLCAKDVLSADQIRQLRRSIETLITQLFALPPAQEGVTEDVRQTIGLWQASQLPHQSGCVFRFLGYQQGRECKEQEDCSPCPAVQPLARALRLLREASRSVAEWTPAEPYPPGKQEHSITSRKELTSSVTFSFEETIPVR